jgi:hypothetical protein
MLLGLPALGDEVSLDVFRFCLRCLVCAVCSEYTLGDRRFVLLRGPHASRVARQKWPVVTLLLRAPTQAIADELCAVAQQCLDVLHATMATPLLPSGQSAGGAFDPRTLCVGGGATEAMLSSYLRMRAARDLDTPPGAIAESAYGSPQTLPPGLRRTHLHYLSAGVEHLAGSLDAFASAVGGLRAGRESGEWRDALHEKHEPLVRIVLTGAANDLDSVPAGFVFGADATAAHPWDIQPIARANSGRLAQAHDPVAGATGFADLRTPRVLDALQTTRRAIELAVDAAANALRCAGAIGGRPV